MTLEMLDDLKYWVALSIIPDVGGARARRLLAEFKTPQDVLGASVTSLARVDGISRAMAGRIASFDAWDDVEKLLDGVEKSGAEVFTLGDPRYPALLREVHSSPPALYVKGTLAAEDRLAVAVVGSRRAAPYGRAVTERIAGELAAMGFNIVSGMARGIDTAAHTAAIKRGGRTTAVLGCGIDVAYPPENRVLMEKIAENGAVVSEFPPGTMPLAENFPRRNRIISGLSLGVLVTEAALNSGALVTANFALEQGREVFAVPGSVMSPNSAGPHSLIQRGAKLVNGAQDIVAELAPLIKCYLKKPERPLINLDADERTVCNALTGDPLHIDDLVRRLGIATSKALTILLNLELKGVVRQTDGKKFYLAG
jgi:DNA processing protein